MNKGVPLSRFVWSVVTILGVSWRDFESVRRASQPLAKGLYGFDSRVTSVLQCSAHQHVQVPI